MEGLGEHGARAGCGVGDELNECDRQVADERGVDDMSGAFGHVGEGAVQAAAWHRDGGVPYNETVVAVERLRRSILAISSRGRNGFDGGTRSRDACRAPLTRKSDGTSVNCGQSVRSRCLIKQ